MKNTAPNMRYKVYVRNKLNLYSSLNKIKIFIHNITFCVTLFQDETSFEIKKTLHKIDSIRIRFDIPAVAFGVVRNDSILLKGARGAQLRRNIYLYR